VNRLAVALAAAATLLLAGCRVDTELTVDVRADGTGTIALTATADAEVVEQAPGLADDLRFDDAEAAGWTVDGPTATDAGGLTVTLRHDFGSLEEATALLASINGAGGPLQGVTLARDPADDAATTLAGSLRVDGGLSSLADPDVLTLLGGATPYASAIAEAGLSPAEALSMTVAVALPGEVQPGTAGTVDGSTVTFTVPLDGSSIDLATVATGATSTGGVWGAVSTALLALAAVWLVITSAFVAWVWWARRRRASRRPSLRA
jgi:hypothetical protein